MTASKRKTITIISIILLAAALIAGIFATSVGGANYIPENTVVLSNTDFVTADTSVKTDGELASGSVAISSARALRSFLQGSDPNGHLTADIVFDWSGEVGSGITFESGRTLDGRGHKITLVDAEANAVVTESDDDASHKNGEGKATDTKYALFVKYNRGTIKNVNFVYDASQTVVNNGSASRNSIGIVCAENTGRIEHCDLNVSGEYKFYFIGGSSNDSNAFATEFGGIAGRNGGVITHISARYNNFTLRVRTKARRSSGTGSVDAKTLAGGIAGIMTANNAECSNIIIIGNEVTFHLTADRYKGLFSEGSAFRQAGAIVSGNSSYSHGTPAKVDNIISDFSPSFTEAVTDSSLSANALIHCGKVTNATILDTRGGGINLQTDNCDCGTNGNAGEHEVNYANIIDLDKWTRATVSFSDDGKQIIDFKPINGWIETHSFTKQIVDSVAKAGEGSAASISVDNGVYDGAPENTSSTNFDEAWKEGHIFEIKPYQTSGKYFWELKGTTWRYAQLEFNDVSSLGYTGGDLLKEFVRFRFDNPNFNDFYDYDVAKMTMRNNGARIYKADKIQNYGLTVAPITANGQQYIYYDEADHIIVPVPENYDAEIVHNYSVVLGKVGQIGGDGGWINDNITLELENGVDGAFDGFVYTVNGSQPWIKNGKILACAFDSSVEGRTYTLYLTKGGVRMTEDYVFNVKVDVTAPDLEIEALNPLDGTYYTENELTLKVSDGGSGVAYVKFDGVELVGENGVYNVTIPESGEYVIEVEDNVGNYKAHTFNAFIDATVPTLNVTATSGGNEYISGTQSDNAVVFTADAVFGEAGGRIEYSIDAGDWQKYEAPVKLSKDSTISFRAVAVTKDNNGDALVTEPIGYEVKVTLKVLEIDNSWLDLSDMTRFDKPYDGTTSVTVEWNLASNDYWDNYDDMSFIVIEANYAQASAGENIPIIVNFKVVRNDGLEVVSKVEGVYGNILKKEVTVTLEDTQIVYGDANAAYKYSVDGVVTGETLKLDFDNNMDEIVAGAEYKYWLANGEYANYTVKNFEEINSADKGAKLSIEKATVSRLVYNAEDIIGLDTDKNIGKINVRFESFEDGNPEILLDSVYEKLQADGTYVPVDGIKEAGYYRVTLSVPQSYADRYQLGAGISTFIIRVIDASIYDSSDVPDNSVDTDGEVQSVTYYLTDGAFGIENTSDIEAAHKQVRDYDAMIAIFCAVLALLSISAAVVLKIKLSAKNRK